MVKSSQRIGYPYRLLLTVIGSVFFIELINMFVLFRLLRVQVNFQSSLIDGLFLVFFLYPVLFYYLYRPMSSEIAARKKAEQEEQMSAQNLRVIFDNASDAIFIHGLDGTIMDVNERVLQLYGVTREEALKMKIRKDFSTPDNPIDQLAQFWELAIGGHPQRFNWRARRPNDGTAFDVEVQLTRVNIDESRAAVLANVRDLTEEKQAEQERVRSLQEESGRLAAESSLAELRDERALRDRFISLLTHDLRTPLTSVRMAAELINRGQLKSADLTRISSVIISALDRAEHYIRDMLDFDRIRAGMKLPVNIQQCDLRAVVKETLIDLVGVHGNRFVFTAAAPMSVRCDPVEMRRALENLCTNAVKYGAPDTPVVVDLVRTDERIRLSVNNQGSPLTPEQMKLIFQPFRRCASDKKGWGIGLTLVKGVAVSHGGTVEVESSGDKGTTFTVQFPSEVELERAA